MQPWRSSSAPAGRQASRGRRLARRGLGQLDRQRSCDGWRVRLGRVERGVIPIGFCPAWHWPSSMPTARVESHLLSADQPCSAGAAQPNRHRSSGHTMARQMASIPDESRASRRLECATRWRRRAVLREPSAGQCSRQGRACSSTSCLADSQRRVVATGALSVSRPGLLVQWQVAQMLGRRSGGSLVPATAAPSSTARCRAEQRRRPPCIRPVHY
jgi:hypothetical protein